MSLSIIVLAAGKGSRMNSSIPKVFHKVGNKEMISHVHDIALSMNPKILTTVISDELKNFIHKIKKENIKVCLCTNKKQHLTNKIIKEFNLEYYFDFILGSSKELQMKPSIQMLEFCLKKLEIKSSEQCVMIGDSDNDILPANKLNMTSIYVRYGYGKLSKNIVASYEVNKIMEIFDICNF